MHSRDPKKDKVKFRQEIDAILDGTSDHRSRDKYDFTHFVFPDCANFTNVGFALDADFSWATFTHAAEFVAATFTQVADFHGARFEQPARVLFEQVNRKSDAGVRARYLYCCIEEVSFTDVHWHRLQGRMVLQDELDIITGEGKAHGLVAVAYRQLVNNFEKTRNYDLAEDCFIGAMEMKRLNPRNFLLGRAEPFMGLYEKYLWAQKVGEWVSVHNAYRLLSIYGSSYTRALAVLFGLLLLCALLFPAFGLRMTENSRPQGVQTSTVAFCPQEASISWRRAWVNDERARELWRTFKAGVWAALEVATFQRRPTVEPATTWGRRLAIPEMVAIPAQLALSFLALRRRFKR